MSQFVLRYDGPSPSVVDLDQIRATPGIQVLDESPKMMLISGEDPSTTETLHAKVKDLPGWSMYPVEKVPLPDTRKKPNR